MEERKDIIIISNEDAEQLTQTIIAVNATQEIFKKSQTDINITPNGLRLMYEIYMENLKTHKMLWIELLNKYVGEENASTYQQLYRFDMYKKCIFLKKIEGCTLCQ